MITMIPNEKKDILRHERELCAKFITQSWNIHLNQFRVLDH